MKKLILFLMLIKFSLMQAQPQPNCDFCINHYESLRYDHAVIMIDSFQTIFKNAVSYGGTIYGSKTDFELIESTTGRIGNDTLLKYHFGLDPKNSNNLILAFENDSCKSYQSLGNTGINGVCLKSADKTFSPVPLLTRLSQHRNPVNVNLSDPIPAEKILIRDVQISKDLLVSTSNPYKDKIGCVLYQGTFDFSSIDAIYADRNCVGIRYYFGYDPNIANRIRVILVGVNNQGENLKIWRENSLSNTLTLN